MEKLDNFHNNYEFVKIVNDILNNNKFLMLKNCKHHGITRFEHSLRVAYYSYLIAKKMKLNYVATARGGLLHDFFINEDLTPKKRRFSVVFHPYKALENASQTFQLSDMEKDIIINHMFPTLPHKVPKYLESWIVSLVDKVVATYEFYYSYGKIFMYRFSNLYVVLLILNKL